MGEFISMNPARTINYPHGKECTLAPTPYPIPHIKIYLRWILDIKIKAKTISFLQENIGKYSHDLEAGNNFFM